MPKDADPIATMLDALFEPGDAGKVRLSGVSGTLPNLFEAIAETFEWLDQMYPSDTSTNNSPDLDEDDDEIGAEWDEMSDYDLDGDDDDEEDDDGGEFDE